MAYQIDFTASNYTLRNRRKAVLRGLLVATAVATAWGIRDCYVTYNQPTLNMRLADYEAVARPIEDINAKWDAAAKEYDSLAKYYRLVWASNATNFLSAMAADGAPRLPRGLCPTSWILTTGGSCVLTYHYAFGPGDRAEQTKGLEARITHMVTSVVEVVGNRVDVRGIPHENLLNVESFNAEAVFSLANASNFPAKTSVLDSCVREIGEMRKKVHELKLKNTARGKGSAPTIQTDALMLQYLQAGRDKPEFPDIKDVINVRGWFDRADSFIAKNDIPTDPARPQLKETWNAIGEARFPWERYRALDNEEIVLSTKALGDVAGHVAAFKGFLERRNADCLKKLEPFVGAYRRQDVFNNPIVEPDLRDRAARAAGIVHADVPKPNPAVDEIANAPAVLVKKDEKFTFTWVKWTLHLGTGLNHDGTRRSPGEGETADVLTLQKVADCARRVVELGPGYALDRVRVTFDAKGGVSGAVLEGLLPVKRSDIIKKESGHVN